MKQTTKNTSYSTNNNSYLTIPISRLALYPITSVQQVPEIIEYKAII